MQPILSLIIFVFCFGLYAQTDNSCNYSISGKILDADTKEPISSVFIKVIGTEKNAMTNARGEYKIDGLCNKENTLVFSCVGYCESFCEHRLSHDNHEPHIYLSKSVVELETVSIQSKKKKKEGTESIAQIILKKSDIINNPTQSLALAISSQTGVSMSSVGSNVQLPIIHGLYGNRILILNNGLKHGFQNWGNDHAPEIDVSSANSITIIKGAAGVRFGAEALGGAIIVEPNQLTLNQPLNGTINSGYQTNGKGLNTNIELAQGFSQWSYYLNGNLTKIGDRNTPDYSLTNSGKEEKSFGFGSRYHLEKWDFKINYSFVDQNLALLRSSVASSGDSFIRAINANEPTFINPFSYDINEPNQRTQHHFGKAEINWFYNNKEKLTFRLGKQINKRQEFDVRRNEEKPIIDLELITSDYQLEWKHANWFNLDGMIGVQYFTQNNDNNPGTGTTAFIPNYNTHRYSGYLIENKRFGKNLVELGVRLDYETNNVRGRETNQNLFSDEYEFANLTSSVGFVRQFSENSSFRTNFGTAWRTPNMAELYSFGQHGFKNSYGLLRYNFDTNGVLKTDEVQKMNKSSIQPERGYKFINEFQWNKNKNNHIITAYSHYIENYIFDRPIAVRGTFRGPMPAFIVDQTNALFFGADYSWKKEWSAHFSGTYGLSYLWSRNSSKNEPLIHQPPISTNYKLDWKHSKFWKLNESKISIKPSYTFAQFQAPRTVSPESLIDGSVVIDSNSEIFDFTDAPKGYFLLDLSWNLSYKNWNGNIAIHNMLNNRYRSYLNEMRYFADEMGRNILVNISYNFTAKK